MLPCPSYSVQPHLMAIMSAIIGNGEDKRNISGNSQHFRALILFNLLISFTGK